MSVDQVSSIAAIFHSVGFGRGLRDVLSSLLGIATFGGAIPEGYGRNNSYN